MTISRDRLRFFSPFDTLSDDYLDKVLEKIQVQEMPKGKIVFQRGKSLSQSFYLLEGRVDLIDTQFERHSLESGEEGSRHPLNNNLPTQVSVLAKTPVSMLSLERDFVDLVMAWSQSAEQTPSSSSDEDEHDWMSYLLESPLFARVPPGNIQQLFVRFFGQEANAGDVVVHEGEPGDYFYVLAHGRARVLDKAGKLLAELGPGDYFGEEALVGETTRNASVEMISDGSLMCLEKEDFHTLLQAPMMRLVSAEELEQWPAKAHPAQLLDVRMPMERRAGHVPDSRNLPLGKLRKALPELSADYTYVVTDDAGRRSRVAAQLLLQTGLDAVILDNAEQLHPETAR